jgi:hypothetical protein
MNLPILAGFSGVSSAIRTAAKPAAPVLLLDAAKPRPPAGLPAAIAFLINYGVSADELKRAAREARRQGVPPEAPFTWAQPVTPGFTKNRHS